MTIQRTGLFSSPTMLRAAEPSLEITTRWCNPAPWASMATCGTPSGSPVWVDRLANQQPPAQQARMLAGGDDIAFDTG